MTEPTDPRWDRLLETIRRSPSAVVAVSGGVDSTLLLHAAARALGPDKVLAVTLVSAMYPEHEAVEAEAVARSLGVPHRRLTADELLSAEFRANPPNRCYLCKRALFGRLAEIARTDRLEAVMDGTNADDRYDYRPGRRALQELGIRSPLEEAGLGKDDVRAISRARGIEGWDRPAMACLASRIPFGEEITPARLGRIGRAEAALRARGFPHVRVRDHGACARIEVPAGDVPRLVVDPVRIQVVRDLKAAGYAYVAIDLEGYRTGAMNEALTTDERHRP